MSPVQVLYLIEAVDEYCIQSLPEFEGKKFQNAAKEGFKLDASEKAKERKEALATEFEPMLKWLKEDALKDKVEILFCDDNVAKELKLWNKNKQFVCDFPVYTVRRCCIQSHV